MTTATTRRPRRSARRPTEVTVAPPVLTPRLAEQQARHALVEAGLMGHISRIVTDTGLRPGHIGCLALLRVGADPQEIATVLEKLGDVQCGEAYVAVYRKGAP